MANLFFFSIFIIECFLHPPDEKILHCFALHFSFFCTQWQICFFLAYLLLSVFYTRLMRPNKVETGRGLLT